MLLFSCCIHRYNNPVFLIRYYTAIPAKVTAFALNSRKSLQKAKSLLRYFKAFRLQSEIADLIITFLFHHTLNMLHRLIPADRDRAPDGLPSLPQ
jgi:hypothetical protein